MTIWACLLSRSLLGAKRTSRCAAHVSAYDPKRTSKLTIDQSKAGSSRAGGLEPILVQIDRQRVIGTAAEHIAHPEEHAA
jgi:hypothetical protein